MRKVNLGNLYESPVPLENVNDLWADIDEDSKDIRAIHRYNKGKSEWEPYLVSVDYIKPDSHPEGWNSAIRKHFHVDSFKTFVQQYADGDINGTFNVVAILVPELEQSVGYVSDYSDLNLTIVDNDEASITIMGNLTMPYSYPIRIVLTPNFDGVWEEKTTVNNQLKVSLTFNN